MKKALSALLAAVMVLGLLALAPITANAANPSAPKNLVLTPGDGTITVMCDLPDDQGDIPVDSYYIFCSAISFTHRVTLSAMPYTMTGLTNGTEYTIQVCAYGAGGQFGATVQGTCTPHATGGGGTDPVDDSAYFKLWSKTTTYLKSNFWNWILLIVCFGWIWMAF
ncbi:MAG: fibronectin type III domain-containing protein [Oscillospiraceae bacterium]|nr:fibronectin type III domain-containing protein [Oscillospiraceae bacterium]